MITERKKILRTESRGRGKAPSDGGGSAGGTSANNLKRYLPSGRRAQVSGAYRAQKERVEGMGKKQID